MFLVNSCQENFRCAPPVLAYGGEALSRSYGCFFAEFLGDHSLVRLGLLDLITCVGLRYGFYIHKFREFSWKRALYHYPPTVIGELFIYFGFTIKSSVRIFLHLILSKQTSNPIMSDTYYTPSSHHKIRKSGNINPVSIEYGFRHSLRPD